MRRRRQRKKGGRPTKYSPAVAWRICEAVARGCSREGAAALAGISVSTLHEWRNEFPEFSDGLEKADARFEAACVASVRQAGRDPRKWTASAWLLERKFPQRYGRIDRHVIGTQAQGKPLPEDYINAIGQALGYTGKLIPIDANANSITSTPTGDEPIDVEALPQD